VRQVYARETLALLQIQGLTVLSFIHDGINFHYRQAGEGVPFVFQHGLGGDTNQTFGIFHPPSGFRLLTLDCRAHGLSRPLGALSKLSIAAFADDVITLLDRLGIQRAIVGGISMGAAVSLNLALRFPERVLALVLSRAAWLARPLRSNVRVYTRIAGLIRRQGAKRASELFRETELYRAVRRDSSDAAESLLRQFEDPHIEERYVRLERIARDSPYRSLKELERISVPTLILASRQDPIHPFTFGEILAKTIAGAEFLELTAKSIDKDRHVAEVQDFIASFLRRRCADLAR
jgi:pimeloyl-ACP methyl ester carboxylesterase